MTAPPRGFAEFLRRSLSLLSTHATPAYAEVAKKLGSGVVALEVDGEALSITARQGRIEVIANSHDRTTHAQPRSTAARARTSRRALVALLEGRVDLVQAVWQDAVELQGPLEALLRFYDALRAYFRAAVGCPEFAALLDEYLAPRRVPGAAGD